MLMRIQNRRMFEVGQREPAGRVVGLGARRRRLDRLGQVPPTQPVRAPDVARVRRSAPRLGCGRLGRSFASLDVIPLIEEDEDIALLILAASSGTEGPGPLVASLAKTAGTFPIPVAIVPGHLSDEDIESMS